MDILFSFVLAFDQDAGYIVVLIAPMSSLTSIHINTTLSSTTFTKDSTSVIEGHPHGFNGTTND